ncbi:hypothetical protein, partial [Caldithrix abyssi]
MPNEAQRNIEYLVFMKKTFLLRGQEKNDKSRLGVALTIWRVTFNFIREIWGAIKSLTPEHENALLADRS